MALKVNPFEERKKKGASVGSINKGKRVSSYDKRKFSFLCEL